MFKFFPSCTVAVTGLLSLLVLPAAAAPGKEAADSLRIARQLNEAFIQAAESVSPSVVVIRVAYAGDRNPSRLSGPLRELLPPELREQYEEELRKESPKRPSRLPPQFDGQGSGVMLREDGYILTNGHVVEGADQIRVRFSDGREFPAELRGTDPQSDVAVLKVNARGLRAARLGDSDKTRVGEFAIAIGAPFELDYSVTYGHVSAKGRSNILRDGSMDQDFIQTDASINPGNSGGPLVNLEGEVIGINTMIRGINTGIGFAIPINLAREVAEGLIAEGKYTRAWLGIGIQALTEYADFQGLAPGVERGVVVTGIKLDGPSGRSTLEPADIITAVDGKPVATVQQLRNAVRSKSFGQPVTLAVVRAGREVKVRVEPEPWPEPVPVVARTAPEPAPAEETEMPPDIGMKVTAITPALMERYELTTRQGLIVTAVERGSLAEIKRIRPGDLVTQVDRKPVSNPKQYREAVKRADLRKGVLVHFVSGGFTRFEVFKAGGD